MKQEGQDVAICGGGRGWAAHCEMGREVAALQKRVLSRALALGMSRWSRTGQTGPGVMVTDAWGLWKGQV